MTANVKRRDFVKAASAAVGALAVGGTPAAAAAAWLRPPAARAPARQVFVRRAVHTLSERQVAALKYGICKMRMRDVTDPTSWAFQANMHTTESPSEGDPEGWNGCQHGSWFFPSWHRMYLYFFERILRAAIGDEDREFALPYWAYGPTGNRAVPLVYRQPADASNELYAERWPWMNAGAELPAAAVNHAAAYSRDTYLPPEGELADQGFGGGRVSQPVNRGEFDGQLQLVPHARIHYLVGGLMLTPGTVNDPLFLAHHAAIDRLWAGWNALGRANPVGDELWMTQPFVFYDEHGEKVRMTAAQILDTEAQLGYRYDELPPLPAAQDRRYAAVRDFAPAQPPADAAVAAAGPVVLGREATTVVLPRPRTGGPRRADARRVSLYLEGVSVERHPGVYYDVFVNLPPGAEGRLDALEADDPHYAGTLGLEPAGHRFHASPGSPVSGRPLAVALPPAARALEAAGRGPLRVTFVQRGPRLPGGGRVHPAAATHIARVSLVEAG